VVEERWRHDEVEHLRVDFLEYIKATELGAER